MTILSRKFPGTSDAFGGLRGERMAASPRFHDGRFHNTAVVSEGLKSNPIALLGEYCFGNSEREPRQALPLADPLTLWAQPVSSGLRVTWLGHSTMLLEMSGMRVLTDPVFGMRASPLTFAGPRRFHPPPVALDRIGKLDAVLISHDHYDHLCRETIVSLARTGVLFVTSLGVGARLTGWSIPAEQIKELDWWEEFILPGRTHQSGAPAPELGFIATPAQHFSGRTLTDRNLTLWSSWVIRNSRHRVFFSGDTGPTTEFSAIGAKYGPFDLVMLEVGAWHPSWGNVHLGPHNALKVHAMLGGGALLPVHWSTFNLALHAWDEPGETLYKIAEQQNLALLTPQIGGGVEPSQQTSLARAWWRR